VAYWYRDFLLSSQLSTLASIRGAKKISQLLVEAQGEKNGNSNTPPTEDDLQDDIEVMIVGFKRTVCRGIVRVSALKRVMFCCHLYRPCHGLTSQVIL
jgi:hypothetical protein